MKKIINDSRNVVHEMLRGLIMSHPELKKLHEMNSVVYDDNSRDVILLSGGGSGHEPLDIGYVGEALLDGAIVGEPFTPPSANQIVKTTEYFGNKKPIIFIVKNFDEDLNVFKKAQTILRDNKYDVELIIVDDDASVDPETKITRRRGVAGTVIIHKILGAAANKGLSCRELVSLGNAVNNNLYTLAVALTGAELPAEKQASFELGENQIFYGIGIHGEEGYRREEFSSSDLLARELINKLVQVSSLQSSSSIAVLINGLGSLPTMESLIFTNDVVKLLQLKDIKPQLVKTGNFLSSYNMDGVSITILKDMNSKWLEYLQMECGGFGWY
ncbi:DhaKLM operon coactivator DhaQ [Companilactobacillus sp. RD055328]|uniref:dihydroxyacetone kinase subunit DhaK n=1 Tax=Companilactobacillus sp. RD055328 TaxID=2916634 RepID=UPI001FC7BE74|nr:dihydroxyacetone kinase subunit DhaK [Companilactobacillus sp. RD055328]GKQ42352.1 DhaKLM operon coactivator DhaQ [Companilactobacillus sp. RD055328]